VRGNSVDNISKLFQLQATNKNAVVSEELNFTDIQENLYIKTEIDQYLIESCIKSKEKNKSFLYVVSGNAGDGKSMQIKKGKQDLLNFLEEDELEINYDATQVDSKTEDLTVRLFEFFEKFFKSLNEDNFKIYIIAMNIGIAIRFFNDPRYKDLLSSSEFIDKHGDLRKFLLNELSIELIKEEERSVNSLLEHIEVINFDHRVLVKHHLNENNEENHSFFGKMLNKVQEIFDTEACQSCSARNKCPVLYNVTALQEQVVKNKIENILFKGFLYKQIHFTPRNLWDFIFNITVGGTNKYLSIKTNSDSSPCETFENLPEHRFNEFTFYNNIYDVESDNAILKYIQSNISKYDPYYLNNKYLELSKIFYQANPDKYIDNLMESLKDNEKFIELKDSKVHLEVAREGKIENLEKITRLLYFHSKTEEEVGDLLYNDSSQVITKENFSYFIDSLEKQNETYIYKTDQKLNKDLIKNLKAALTNIFGTKLKDGSRYFQLETVSTRGKGRLYSKSDIKIPLDTQVNHYMINDSHLKYIDSFPSTLNVNVNNKILEIDYPLFEVIILSSKGYNITSVDLDKFFNLKSKSKSLFSDNNLEQDEIVYEYENSYFKLHYNEDEYENEFIRIN
jgi:hypothetical protein